MNINAINQNIPIRVPQAPTGTPNSYNSNRWRSTRNNNGSYLYLLQLVIRLLKEVNAQQRINGTATTPTITLPPISYSASSTPATRVATVEVVGNSDDWAGSSPSNVQAVLDSVIDTYSAFTGGRQLGKITVRNNPSTVSGNGINAPFALFEKGSNGETQITLKIEGPYRWAQMAYQFAHEVGHLLSNTKAPFNGTGNLWFEEALNEALNLFVMDEMGNRWATNPPYPNWASYAPELKQYVADNRNEAVRQLPQGTTLPQWLSQNIDTMTRYPTAQNYDLVQLISEQLLLPLMKSNPELLQALNYINTGHSAEKIPFSQYLDNWYNAAPETYRPLISTIKQRLLG